MLRNLVVTLSVLLMFDTAGAVRVIEQVENGVELTLGELDLPSAEGGSVSFSACPRCGISTHRLTDSTVFRANGQIVPFAEFLRIATEIRDKPNGADTAMAVVFLDIATGRITRIELRG
jgi:hypothetical protein